MNLTRSNSEVDLLYDMNLPVKRRVSDSFESLANYSLDISVYRRSGKYEPFYTLMPYECDLYDLKEFAETTLYPKYVPESIPLFQGQALSKSPSLPGNCESEVADITTKEEQSLTPKGSFPLIPTMKISVNQPSLPITSSTSCAEGLSPFPMLNANPENLKRQTYRPSYRRSLYIEERSHSCDSLSWFSTDPLAEKNQKNRNPQFFSECEVETSETSSYAPTSSSSSEGLVDNNRDLSISEGISQSRSSIQTEFEIELANRISLYKNSQDTTTKRRIRARQPKEPELPTQYDGDSLQNETLARNSLISDDMIEGLRKTAWTPQGKDVPKPYSINLAYHTAWDVGKRGCAAYRIKTVWKATIFSNKLHFFVMDGTDPISFLTIYSMHKFGKSSKISYKKVIELGVGAIRDGIWNYPRGRIKIMENNDKKPSLILDGIPKYFMDAIIVCIREMEVYIHIYCIKWLAATQEKMSKNDEKTLPQLVLPASPADWAACSYGLESKSTSAECPFSLSRRKPKSLIAPKSEAVTAALTKLKNTGHI